MGNEEVRMEELTGEQEREKEEERVGGREK